MNRLRLLEASLPKHEDRFSPRFIFVLALFFCSGLAALIYEVLWMKELGLLFGNTAYATATTLAAFFSGLAIGGNTFGRIAPRLSNPLRSYACLEFAAAVSVAGYFLILDGYHALYPILFELFSSTPTVFIAVKFALSLLILFPPAFFLGGTLPVMSQYLVKNMCLLGRKVSILYLTNTVGAALGAFLAGFYLPVLLGYRDTYLFAMGLTSGVAILAFLLSRSIVPSEPLKASVLVSNTVEISLSLPILRKLAVLSGFVTICLQVLWTRMFAQVLQNSVYTFTVVLVVFLVFLALGSALAYLFMRSRISSIVCLFSLLIGGAFLVSVTPFVFNAWTDELNYIGGRDGWDRYILDVFAVAAGVMGPPLLFLGAVYPYLIKLAASHGKNAGPIVGQLTALNTIGAILGSVVAGFFILDQLGLWPGIRLMGIVYFLAAFHLLYSERAYWQRRLLIPTVGILLLVTILDTSRLPLVRIDPIEKKESLLELWEGSGANVAVVRRADAIKIKVNNFYTLGGSGSHELEALQGYLPILLHSNPRSVYILGLGTGITAGAGLRFPIKRLVVTEILSDVIKASEKYFGRYNNNLFGDQRVKVIAEDGRNYLAGTKEKFDVIIADLFVPWKAGVGSLYTLEHYQSVRDRLNQDGIFMQWLPAYQLSDREFASIVNTIQKVFPQLTVWRGDFSARKPIIGLLAQAKDTALPAEALLFEVIEEQKDENVVPLLAHYVGNLTSLSEQFNQHPLNLDDKPIIEYQAPITQRLQKDGQVHWLAGSPLLSFMSLLQEKTKFESDLYLKNLPDKTRLLPQAGLYLHGAHILKQQGKIAAADTEYSRYQSLLNATKN